MTTKRQKIKTNQKPKIGDETEKEEEEEGESKCISKNQTE